MKYRPNAFCIAIVNHADPRNPDHWASGVSVRRSRAIRQCLKLRREGNRFAMLFVENAQGDLKPLSLNMDYALNGINAKRDSSVSAGSVPTPSKEKRRHYTRDVNESDESLNDVLVDMYREGLVRKDAVSNVIDGEVRHA